MTPSIACFALPYKDDSGIEYSVTYNPNKPGDELSIMAHGSTASFPLSRLEWLRDALNEVASYERQRQRELESIL